MTTQVSTRGRPKLTPTLAAAALAFAAATLWSCQTDLRVGTGSATGGTGGGTGSGGQGGSATCTMCGDACINIGTDPGNCGRCGHDCLGGTCAGGTCQPITLATGSTPFGALAVGGPYVYWRAANGAVMKVGKAGTIDNPAPPIELAPASGAAPDVGCPWGLAVDTASVYWSNGAAGTLSKVSLDGGTPSVLATEPGYICAVALDAAHVYFTNRATGTVTRMALDGGDAVDLASQQDRPSGLAVDATDVYWVNSEPNAVLKVPRDGGPHTTLVAAASGDAGPLAIHAGYAYWLTSLNFGSLLKVPLGGGTATVLADLQGGQFESERTATIAVDVTGITWGYASKGEWIMTIPSAGGVPAPVALEPATAIATDDAAVYFTTSTSVKKVAR